ncbi:MAG: RNA polymerase sigma factor, partial [Bacteroidia bacterium]
SHFDHPGAELEKKERTRILFEALEGLPEHQKTAFVLSQIEHFPQKETARIMGLSEKAVESLIQRAKANLRKKLGKLYHERRI